MRIRYLACTGLATCALMIGTLTAVAYQDPAQRNGQGGNSASASGQGRNNQSSNAGASNGYSRGQNSNQASARSQSSGQAYANNAPAAAYAQSYYGYTQARGPSRPSQSVQRSISKEEIAEAREFIELVQKLRDPGTEAPRGELRDGLKELLAKQLDRDLANREKALAEIERRAAELRNQLETRRENKEETLKLLMMLVENPSAGLGLPEHWMRLLMPPNGVYANPGYNRPRSSGQNANPFGDDPFGGSDNSDPFGSGSNNSQNDPFGP